MSNTVRLFYFTSDRWGKDNLEKRRLKLSFSNLVNDIFEERPFDFGKGEQGRQLRRDWRNAIDKHSMTQGFISFSESWAVPTMWGHYADNHKGVCLGFDLPSRRGDGVEYADKIDYIDNLHPIDGRIHTDIGYLKSMITFASKTKSSHWSYEKEWRCWFSLSDAEKKLKKAKPDKPFYAGFGENLVLREVIFGVKSTHTSESFKALLRPEDNVEFTTARPSFRRFAMVPQRDQSLIK